MTPPLHALAGEAGLAVDWTDAAGRPQVVTDDALRAILSALGLSAETDDAVEESRAVLRKAAATPPAMVTADVGAPIDAPLAGGRARLTLESGERHDLNLEAAGGRVSLPAIDQPGYYLLETADLSLTIAVAPRRAFGVRDAAPSGRIWAPAVQIPSLRSDRESAFGDFGDVAAAARAFGALGAGALAISPVHALFPADASRYSPYAPSSRLFLNVLFADPALIGAPPEAADPREDLIDWRSATPRRMAHLRHAWRSAGETVASAVAAFAQNGGTDLVNHARFDALHAHFFRQCGATGWPDWPVAYHDPGGIETVRFAAAHDDDVRFYMFLQWLADLSLAHARQATLDAGMAIGLIADLAIGVDPGGGQCWSRRSEMLTGLSIGAPPDVFQPDGQNWGLTTFSPQAMRRTGYAGFIATMRACLRRAGGLRIDHALGLRRLWVTPEGADAADGAYLEYPQTDLFRLLALESHRARAVIVGEDLGTVPNGFRSDMDDRGVMGMRVLWFERTDEDEFQPATAWDPTAAAMTTTHDLPTVAGWWSGWDIDWRWRNGLRGAFAIEAEERAAREADKRRLWRAIADPGSPPPEDAAPVVEAVLAHVGATPSDLAIIPIEDLFALVEQPNMPGSTVEHPNWRRRMPDATGERTREPVTMRRIEALRRAREDGRKS